MRTQIIFTFFQNDVSKCLQVPIIDNDIFGADVYFSIILSTGDPQVHLNPSSVVITIVDNESKD